MMVRGPILPTTIAVAEELISPLSPNPNFQTSAVE